MKWTIGLDLRREGHGALAFARWLRDQTRDPSSLQFQGVHVVEESTLLQALRREHLHDLEARIGAAATEVLKAAGLEDIVEGPHLLEGVDADAALVNEVQALKSDALIIGRKAEGKDQRWLRLGRVARRLLRSLPVPTVVVPPDLDVAGVGDGPVMIATDLEDDSAQAAEFARTFAESIGRSVLVAHIVPTFESGAAFVPAASMEQLYSQLGMEREKSLEAWKRRHGLADAPAVVASGDVVGRLVGIAREERVPLIVTGSRRLSTAERLFNASVGTTLASYSAVPVAIVPPPEIG